MAPKKSGSGDQAMGAQLAALEPGSLRHKSLNIARSFKASWVELAEILTNVYRREDFREWGFSTFDAYCTKELRLKKDTAAKLLRSFVFLQEQAPRLLASDAPRQVPALDVVDLLSQARERTQAAESQVATIEQDVLHSDAETSRAEVLKRFRQVDPEAFKKTPAAAEAADAAEEEAAAGDAPVDRTEIRKMLLLAERLEALLKGKPVSPGTVAGVSVAVKELRGLFDGAPKGKKPAEVTELRPAA